MVKINVTAPRPSRALVLDFPGKDASSVTVAEVKGAIQKQISKVRGVVRSSYWYGLDLEFGAVCVDDAGYMVDATEEQKLDFTLHVFRLLRHDRTGHLPTYLAVLSQPQQRAR
jgi:hypothetical protein